MDTKICRKCGRELQLEMFRKNNKSNDGLNYYCRDCVSAQRKQHRESKMKEVKGDDNPLDKFKPRELIDELRRRGYHGTITYTHKIEL